MRRSVGPAPRFAIFGQAQGSPLLQASVLAAAVIFGVLAAIQPIVAIALAMACMLAYVIFTDLAVGFGVLMFVSFLSTIVPSSGALSATKGVGLLLTLAWLAQLSRSRRGARDFFADQSRLIGLLLAFVGWCAITLLWAQSPGAGLTSLYQYVLTFLLFPIGYTAIRRPRDLKVVLVWTVLGAVVAAASAVLQPPNPEVIESTRATGTIGDPNELAAAMLVGLSLGAGLALARSNSTRVRVFGLLAIPLCAGAIFLSASRGGLVALGAVLLVATVTAGRWRTAVVVLLVVIATGGVLYFTQFAPPPARERIVSVNTGSGRTELWDVGIRMFRAHPAGGVGVGNYQAVSPDYVLLPGSLPNANLILVAHKVAHNAYLEVLADTGVPGLLMLLAVIAASLRCMLSAARVSAERGNVSVEALTRAVFLATAGMLTAEFFISDMHSKVLWGLLALGPAMLVLARHEPTPPTRQSCPEDHVLVEPVAR